MILTPAILDQIVTAIREDPTAPVILPDHAYGKSGRVVVLVDRIPIDLHRHLHNLLIRPLGYHEVMHEASGIKGNVNPHLYVVVAGRKSARTHCNQGHAYEGNEAPPNSRGYRCLTCYRNSYRVAGGLSNADKTHCPQGHEYTPENTRVTGDGRRRCITCTRKRTRDRMRIIRAQQKENHQ